MVGYGESSAGSYLTNHTPPIPSHCASTVVTNTVRINMEYEMELITTQNKC